MNESESNQHSRKQCAAEGVGEAGHSGPRGRGVGWADSAEERSWILKSR